MVKRLARHGNSFAIVLDRPILDLLRATPETRFEVITDGQSLVLTPIRGAKAQKRFDEALADVHRRFGRAMKRLAE